MTKSLVDPNGQWQVLGWHYDLFTARSGDLFLKHEDCRVATKVRMPTSLRFLQILVAGHEEAGCGDHYVWDYNYNEAWDFEELIRPDTSA